MGNDDLQWDSPRRLDATVTDVWFHSPSGRAALHAFCALAATSGSLLVVDAGAGDSGTVVLPDERPQDLAAQWPWEDRLSARAPSA